MKILGTMKLKMSSFKNLNDLNERKFGFSFENFLNEIEFQIILMSFAI